jgi:hypothetical protein
MLVRAADLPAGFQLNGDTADYEGMPPMTGTTASCSRAINAMYAEHPPARAGAALTRPYPGGMQVTAVQEEFGSWPAAGAAKSMTAAAGAPGRCRSWSRVDQQYGTVRTTVTPLACPHGIGEESVCYQLITNWPTRGNTHEILLFARSDTRRMTIDYLEPVGRVMNQALFHTIVAAAVRRLAHWHTG